MRSSVTRVGNDPWEDERHRSTLQLEAAMLRKDHFLTGSSPQNGHQTPHSPHCQTEPRATPICFHLQSPLQHLHSSPLLLLHKNMAWLCWVTPKAAAAGPSQSQEPAVTHRDQDSHITWIVKSPLNGYIKIRFGGREIGRAVRRNRVQIWVAGITF